ncbi:hypothetical protein, partial [Pseudomonas cyclaminis]|uniref:hypothetical protein n=1 Tax=Pseudomonas cyclaminis TaxID=2781239 RepID=UPI0019D62AF7
NPVECTIQTKSPPSAGFLPSGVCVGLYLFLLPHVFSIQAAASQFLDAANTQLWLASACSFQFFDVKDGRAVYHCARQPRRGLWNTSMDLPSSYSVPRFTNHELTD